MLNTFASLLKSFSHKQCQPGAGAAVTIMAIWARSLSSSFSNSVIFFRASGSVACRTDLPPLWAWFRAGPGYLTTSRFTVLCFCGGKWFLWRWNIRFLFSLNTLKEDHTCAIYMYIQNIQKVQSMIFFTQISVVLLRQASQKYITSL